ncbi:MAG: hypothetical protein LCH62_16725 [Proteobacteria bacterium]|nr:hypothetical protein [Pseudomonadota bacterium]
MSGDDISKNVTKAVEHARDWLRQDLASKDAGVRARAEETLAAMITPALKK